MSEKKRLLAFLLAFFLGVSGAHRFYVGKTGSAIPLLIIDLTLVGFAVTGIWSLVDWIIILCGEFTDKHGNKITEWT